jgi:hypothetical protein
VTGSDNVFAVNLVLSRRTEFEFRRSKNAKASRGSLQELDSAIEAFSDSVGCAMANEAEKPFFMSLQRARRLLDRIQAASNRPRTTLFKKTFSMKPIPLTFVTPGSGYL